MMTEQGNHSLPDFDSFLKISSSRRSIDLENVYPQQRTIKADLYLPKAYPVDSQKIWLNLKSASHVVPVAKKLT